MRKGHRRAKMSVFSFTAGEKINIGAQLHPIVHDEYDFLKIFYETVLSSLTTVRCVEKLKRVRMMFPLLQLSLN